MSNCCPAPDAPTRVIHHADAIEWLNARDRIANASIITSLPDSSELPQLGLERWCSWFSEAAALTCSRVCEDGVAIFYQSDAKHAGGWIDKSVLVARGAERSGMRLLVRSIICRVPPGTACYGRPGYSQLLVYAWPSRALETPQPWVDVIPDAGFKPSEKSMGVNACLQACGVVCAQTTTRTVVDPFCGFGTVLAVANALGLDAIGVDRSKRMCQRARRLRLSVPLGSGQPDQGPGNSPSAQLRPDGEAGKVKLAGSEPLGKDASTEMNQFVAEVGQL